MNGLSIDVEQLVYFQELVSKYLESVSTSLSKYFKDRVLFDLQKFHLVSSEQIEGLLDEEKDEKVLAVCVKTADEISSEFVFVINENDLEKLSEKVSESFKVSIPKYKGSIFTETCNIISGSFLNDVCNATGLVTIPNPPVISNDLYSPILNSCVIEMMNSFENVVLVKCNFIVSGLVIKSLIVLDSNDVQKILECVRGGKIE